MTPTLLPSVLLAATVTSGLVAGFLAGFAHTVMPGLAGTTDGTYVHAFAAIDRAVTNPWFLVPFATAPLSTTVALAGALVGGQGGLALLVGLGLALLAVGVLVTTTVHLPLNAAIQSTVRHGSADGLTEARAQLEQRWVPWNVVRTVSSTAAFVCLALSLLRVR